MSEKHIVVQGATCSCQFGSTPDKLQVKTHTKEYVNDADGSSKAIATTKEIGTTTLQANSFGSCLKMGTPPPPCKVNITEWNGFYEKVTLSNGGKALLEDSKAQCAIAGSFCISVINHGQTAELSAQNFLNANRTLQSQINPLVDIKDMDKEESSEALEDWNKLLTEINTGK